MALITNIIDAIRRIGSATQRSALKRQDKYLSNKIVTDRRRETARSSSGRTECFVATMEPVPEAIRPFDEEELQAIEENGALLPELFRVFSGHSPEVWGPGDLDAAFGSWAGAADHSGYDAEAIVQILGAAFGQSVLCTYPEHAVGCHYRRGRERRGSAGC